MGGGVYFSLLALAVLNLNTDVYGQKDLTLAKVQIVGENIRNWLLKQHKNYSHVDILKQNMHGAFVRGIEPRVEIDKARDAIVQLLAKKREAVQRLVSVLENATTTYEWQDKLEANFSSALYMNGSELEAAAKLFNASFKEDKRLNNIKTLKNVPGAHIPVEVYQGYPEIVNGMAWSKCLDEAFEENAANDLNISWQYFAASAGFTRIYPATKWPVPAELGDADLYDARRRSWFVRGSTLPKDILIMMDRSGSVHGQTFTIMKFAVQTLINTLGEDDFVNVAVFNETASWALNCSDALDTNEQCSETATLMQASTDNKLKLFRTIDALEDGGMTNYTRALEFSYEAMLQHNQEVGQRGANCHQLIMIFSDGGTDQAQEVMDEYKLLNETKNVRIFTYGIGPHPIPTVVLKQMACQTGGLFTVITSNSGVRNLIQDSVYQILWEAERAYTQNSSYEYMDEDDESFDNETISEGYIHHLAKPPPNHPKRGSTHPATTNTPYIDFLTERLSIAITQPVYNHSKDASPSARSPPLIGVAGVDLPIVEIESHTVSETLGPTGYFFLVNHNGFVAMHPQLKVQHFYLQDPPNRDILDLEWPSYKMDEVRRHMVEGRKEGLTLIKHKHLLTDPRHLVPVNDDFQYWFLPIPDTTYSLGMVVRNRSQHLGVTPFNNKSYPFDNYTTKLPHWILPTEQIPRSGLVWSARWTNEIVRKWRQSNIFDTVADRLLAFTRFGLTRFHAESQSWPKWLQTWLDPRHNPSLKRAEFGEELSVFPTQGHVMMTSPVTYKGLVVASVGINFHSEFVREGFISELQNAGVGGDKLVSVLLDDGAFVVTSQFDELVTGLFLGNTPGGRVLLDYLVQKNVYQYITYLDQQAVCGPPPPPPSNEVSSGRGVRPFLTPPKSWAEALTTFRGLLQFVNQMYYFVIGLLLSLLTPPSQALMEFGVMSFEGLEKQPCVMKRNIYTWGVTNRTAIQVNCGMDKGKVLASRIDNTNLLLVTISGCPFEKLMQMVDDDNAEGDIDIYDGLNITDHLDQRREVTQFRETFASKVTSNLPPEGEEERLPESKWCCASLFRKNNKACRRGGVPSNNTCTNGGKAMFSPVLAVTPITNLAASFATCVLAGYLAKY